MPSHRLVEPGKVAQEFHYIDAFIDAVLHFDESMGLHLMRVYSIPRKRYE